MTPPYWWPGGDAILLDFNTDPVNISNISTVHNFWMEGANTSMSDASGNLLFYSNGCYIVNADGQIMENGASINPGMIQDIYCSGVGSPWGQGVVSIPAPGNNDLYYVFNLDMTQPFNNLPNLDIAPERLYYQVVDMNQDNGLGSVFLKNQVTVLDTLGRGQVLAAQHANGHDWWIIVPKSNSNCYFLTHVTCKGPQDPLLECEGIEWSDADLTGQAVFSP